MADDDLSFGRGNEIMVLSSPRAPSVMIPPENLRESMEASKQHLETLSNDKSDQTVCVSDDSKQCTPGWRIFSPTRLEPFQVKSVGTFATILNFVAHQRFKGIDADFARRFVSGSHGYIGSMPAVIGQLAFASFKTITRAKLSDRKHKRIHLPEGIQSDFKTWTAREHAVALLRAIKAKFNDQSHCDKLSIMTDAAASVAPIKYTPSRLMAEIVGETWVAENVFGRVLEHLRNDLR